LTATKLWALEDRRKRRDIYDLAQIGAFDLDERALRKLTLYYSYRARMIFHYAAFRANVEERLRRRNFADDVRGLIRGEQRFDWQEASHSVLKRFAFLQDLDERDKGFQQLARHLLGGPLSEHEAETLAQIEHLIAWLMEGSPITSEAAALRQDGIRLFAGA